MDDNHNHRKDDEEDIITNLSENLINPILELLPVDDAVRTSILSKKWRYRWTTISSLDLGYHFSRQFLYEKTYSYAGFIRVVSHIMIHHKGPIFKFNLHIPKILNLDSFQEVDQWMLILSRNSVKELNLINYNQIYRISSSVFSCLELTVLVLRNCVFKPPLDFQGFPNLEDLFLKDLSLRGIAINLPRLERLALHNCADVNTFNIKAENMQTLLVAGCPDAIAMVLRFLRSEQLETVSILQSVKALFQGERFSFTIDGYYLKILAVEKFPTWLPRALTCLRKLNFKSLNFGDLNKVQGALYMLRSTPNLKQLCVEHMPMDPDEDDSELTSSYLESPECLDRTLIMLQIVEMTSLKGSRPELLFVKLLLDHSPHLERMIIRPCAMADFKKMLSIAKDVLMLSRASTKAKVVFLDP